MTRTWSKLQDTTSSTCCSVHDIPVALPHEALHDELTGTPQVLEDLQSLVDRDAMRQHTLHILWSAAHGAAVVPLAFYCDGAPFAKRDGFLAFWIQNLISGNRTLACVLRKSSLCQCGCRGYCTLFPLLEVLRWSIGVMGTGYFPTATDPAGTALTAVRAAVVRWQPKQLLSTSKATGWNTCQHCHSPHGHTMCIRARCASAVPTRCKT